MSRKELVEAGLDPNEPDYGRALCESCHNSHTAKTQGFAKGKSGDVGN